MGNSLLLGGRSALELNLIYIFCRVVLQHIIKIEGASSPLNGSQSSEEGNHFVLNSPGLYLQNFNSSVLICQHKHWISNAALHAKPTFWISPKWKTVNVLAVVSSFFATLPCLLTAWRERWGRTGAESRNQTGISLAWALRLVPSVGRPWVSPLTSAMALCAGCLRARDAQQWMGAALLGSDWLEAGCRHRGWEIAITGKKKTAAFSRAVDYCRRRLNGWGRWIRKVRAVKEFLSWRDCLCHAGDELI